MCLPSVSVGGQSDELSAVQETGSPSEPSVLTEGRQGEDGVWTQGQVETEKQEQVCVHNVALCKVLRAIQTCNYKDVKNFIYLLALLRICSQIK